MGSYASDEDVYLPLSASRDLLMEHDGSTECWGNSGGDQSHLETVNCTWLQFWVQWTVRPASPLTTIFSSITRKTSTPWADLCGHRMFVCAP